MRKSWIQRFQTVFPSGLRHKRNHRHGDPYEAVLEDSKPNNLAHADVSASNIFTCRPEEPLTLNQVNPLLGVLHIPRLPPQHR